MPRRKRIDDEIEIEQKVIEVDPQDAKVRKIFAGMPGGLKCVSVFRYPEGNKGGRPEYLDDISPEQFDMKTMKTMFGGGRFYVRWDNEDGTDSKSNFDIAAPRFNFDEKKEDAEEESDASYLRIPPEMQQAQQNGQVSAMELVKMMQEARRDARAEFREMLEIMRPASSSPDATKQVFEMVEKIAPLIGSGGESGGSPIMTAITLLREPLSKLIDTISVAVNRPAVPVVYRPNPPVTPAPTVRPVESHAATPEPMEPIMMLKMMVRPFLPMLVGAASKNGAPVTYADMILDHIPENQYTTLEEFLKKPGCLTELAELEPAITHQQAWWDDLRAILLTSLHEELHGAASVQHEASADELTESD